MGKTTLVIDDQVMLRVKEEAARRDTTISALVDAALRRLLSEIGGDSESRPLPRLPSFRGGRVLVDVADRDALYRVMEGR